MNRLTGFAAVAAVMLPLSVFAADSASGVFTAKGSATSFKHAYAFWKAAWNEPGKQYLHVLLSDVPVASDAVPKNDEAIARIAGLLRDGKVHAFELRFETPMAEKLYGAEQGAIYHNGVSPGRMGINGMLRYQRASLDGGLLKGKVTVDPAFASTLEWNVDATFEVNIPPAR